MEDDDEIKARVEMNRIFLTLEHADESLKKLSDTLGGGIGMDLWNARGPLATTRDLLFRCMRSFL